MGSESEYGWSPTGGSLHEVECGNGCFGACTGSFAKPIRVCRGFLSD